MHLEQILSGRIHMQDIQEALFYIAGNDQRKLELYQLIHHENQVLSYQALWVLTHLNVKENEWLFDKQGELIDEVLICAHPGKRRLLLNLLLKQPVPNPLRVDFLDFCLQRMISKDELPGVQSLCIKLAYEQCRSIPELLQELRTILDMMQPDLLAPAIRSVRNNILKKLPTL